MSFKGGGNYRESKRTDTFVEPNLIDGSVFWGQYIMSRCFFLCPLQFSLLLWKYTEQSRALYLRNIMMPWR